MNDKLTAIVLTIVIAVACCILLLPFLCGCQKIEKKYDSLMEKLDNS